MMNSDCAYRIGKTHMVCQDYAVSHGGEQPYVILSDGCSSSPDTDVGARLLTQCAARILGAVMSSKEGSLLSYHVDAITSARRHVDQLGVDPACLDATLLTIQVAQGTWTASVYGDGVLAAKSRDGHVLVKSISFAEGCPFYPNYLTDAARMKAFTGRPGNLRTIDTMTLHADGRVEQEGPVITAGDAPCYSLSGDTEKYEWVAVLSDGVHSFTEGMATETSRIQVPIPLPRVLREVLAFKAGNGVFAQRRMQKFLQQCAARSWQHYDDLSLGVVSMG